MADPKKINLSTHGHLSGAQVRAAQERVAAADKLADMWADFRDNEPLRMELLLPEELRGGLDELTRTTQAARSAATPEAASESAT